MTALQPFLISEFKTGLSSYLQPWKRPQDAFEPLTNSYVYRGVVTKRNGSTILGNQLGDTNPVMGIMTYQNESNGTQTLVVGSTQNLYKYVPGSSPDSGTFSLLTSIGGSNSVFYQLTITGTGAAQTVPAAGSIPTFWPNLTASSVTISASAISVDGSTPNLVGTISDDGAGNFTVGASGCLSNGGTVNYTTGNVSGLQFTGVNTKVYTLYLSITATTTGNYFTGNIKNFFNFTNWQPTSSGTSISTPYLYMTNNNDPVTIFDGTYLARPVFYVDSASTTYITKALDVKVYSNRLLLFRPTILNEANTDNQAVYYSALFNPFNFVTDVAGNGGFLSAATGDLLQSAKFLRDNLIVAFSNSHWSLQVSGLVSPPFIFRKLNASKNVSCPYGAVNYDERITNLGSTGFLACDGVNIQRYDIPIVDYYETQINQGYFNQVFAQRYDNLNQTWIFYPSSNADRSKFPLVGSIAPGCDQTLVYNFFENTWATYQNSFPMTCMGLYNVVTGTRWQDLPVTWESVDAPWFSYGSQSTQPILLGGDTTGNVYHLDNPIAVRDGEIFATPGSGTSFEINLTTTRWNPFVSLGQKTQFAYIDIYYAITSTDPTDPIQVKLSFFTDNSELPASSRTLTLDGPVNSEYAFKRVYCNLSGEFIQMNIDPVEDSQIQFLGFILWCRPAGRLTP